MRKRSFLSSMLVVASLLATGCSAGGEQPASDATADVGKRLYENRCASCHGADGAGDTPMGGGGVTANLKDGQWTYGGNPRDIERSISEGIPGTAMRGFKSQMTPDEIGQLAAHVKSFEGQK